MQGVESRTWRRYGYGGPPEPWDDGARRDVDRLATSYYLDILDSDRRLTDAQRRSAELDELRATATRQKHEIDYTLRHWATPVERARVEDRLGQLMRISRRLRVLVAHDGAWRHSEPAGQIRCSPPRRSNESR